MRFDKYFLTDRSPFMGEPQFNIAPLIGGALIGAGASLLGGILGNKNTSSTNAANQQIANTYNENQLQIAKMNNDFNYKMWKEQNEYNTPANQMQRYRDAGINPYMALGSMNAGNADSSITASVPNTQAPPALQQKDYSFVGNTLASASQVALNAANAYNVSEQGKGQSLQNRYDLASLSDRINKTHEDYKMALKNNELLSGHVNLFNRTYANQIALSDMSVQQAQQEILRSQASINQINQDVELKKVQKLLTSNQAEKLRYYIDNVAPVELENLRKSGRLSEEQIKTELSKQALNYSGVNLNNSNAGLARMQSERLDNLLDYEMESMAIDNGIKALNKGILGDTYGATVGQAYSNWYKSGIYQTDFSSGMNVGLGKFGSFGVGFNQRQTKNFLWDKDYYDKQGNLIRAGANRSENASRPTIKRRSKRYNGNYYH